MPSGATISAGTVRLRNGGTTGSMIRDVAINGTLAFGRHAAFALGVWASITGAAAMPADAARGENSGSALVCVLSHRRQRPKAWRGQRSTLRDNRAETGIRWE